MTFIYEEDKSLILNASRIYVSYSGGADSTYALVKSENTLMIKLSSKLTALHLIMEINKVVRLRVIVGTFAMNEI